MGSSCANYSNCFRNDIGSGVAFYSMCRAGDFVRESKYGCFWNLDWHVINIDLVWLHNDTRKIIMAWSGGLIDWIKDDTAYISVVFSWEIQRAYQRAVWLKSQGYKVVVGGTAIALHADVFDGVANIGKSMGNILKKHNPDATRTTYGCIRSCDFCIVPKSEGEYIELDDWEVKPIICDNNITAASRKHFDRAIDRLKPLKGIDFNQGLDARLLTKHHAERLRELNTKVIRLAWDHIEIEKQFMRAWGYLRDAGIPASHIQAYVILGWNDTPEDALYRLQTIKDLGGLPNPMRYQPLTSVKRNSYIHPNWTEYELKAFMRYWSRQRFLRPVPFDEYLEGYKKNGHPEETIFKG